MQYCNKRGQNQVYLSYAERWQYRRSQYAILRVKALLYPAFRRDYGSSMVRLRLAPHEITARVFLQNSPNDVYYHFYAIETFSFLIFLYLCILIMETSENTIESQIAAICVTFARKGILLCNHLASVKLRNGWPFSLR